MEIKEHNINAKKIRATIIIELENPYTENKGKFVKTEIARILGEFVEIEASQYGGQHQVETYIDKFGNKLISIVAFDHGYEIPYTNDVQIVGQDQ